jgi:hypothetical protein
MFAYKLWNGIAFADSGELNRRFLAICSSREQSIPYKRWREKSHTPLREEATAMTAVKTVPFPTRSSTSLNRSRLQRPPRRASFTEQGRTESWPGGIERITSVVAEDAPKPRIVLRPMLGPHDGLDVTQAVTRAIAQELWNLHGGNDVMNWIEAERLLVEFMNARQTSGGSNGES